MPSGARKWVSAALALLCSVTASNAATIVLTFEGLKNTELVENYYNGGLGGFQTGNVGGMSGPGPSNGVVFTLNTRAYIDSDAGGTGNFGHEPSPNTVLLVSGPGGFLNIAAGFDTGFSTYYAAAIQPASVTIWSGLNGTGSLLATLNLPQTPQDGGDPTGLQSPFVPAGIAFAGIAKSVNFAGAVDKAGFDNITLGSAVPVAVPLPASAWAGSLLLAAFAIRRKLAKA